MKLLKGFTKIHLEPDEARVVKFTLPPESLQFVNPDGEWIAEAGEFVVAIDSLSREFTLK